MIGLKNPFLRLNGSEYTAKKYKNAFKKEISYRSSKSTAYAWSVKINKFHIC